MNMNQIAGLFEDFIPSYECHASPGAQGSITLQFDSRVTSDAHFTIQGITPERLANEQRIQEISQTLQDEFALVRAGLQGKPRL